MSSLLPPLLLAVALAGATTPAREVSRAELLAAMQASAGYDLTATANGARLQAEVLLRLAPAAAAAGGVLRIGAEEWFLAYLDRVGLDAARAPLYARLAHEHRQATLVDYRRERVIARTVAGPSPRLAANVLVSWPAEPGASGRFSYDDELASPRLRVTMEREVSYRLLDYGDMLVYAELAGLRGRPTSGPLGLLFNLIGEARLLESRMAIAADGVQVSRGRGRKGLIDVTATVTVWPSGRAEKGIPGDRPDLAALEARLKQRLEHAFVPLPFAPAPAP